MSTEATSRPHPLRRNFRLCTCDGLAAMPAVFLLTPGNFAVAALLTGLFQLPPGVYGVIVSMPFWCNFLQLGLTPLLGKLRPQRIAVGGAAVQSVLLLILGLALPHLPVDSPERSAPWLLGIFAALGLTWAFCSVGWTSWAQEWIPERLRGRYFGARNQIVQTGTVIFLLLVGWILRRFENSVSAFQGIILGAAAIRMYSAWLQHSTQTPPHATHAAAATRRWPDQLALLRGRPSFLWFVAFSAAWGFAANCIGPFYAVFMYQQIGLTAQSVSFLTVLVSVGGVLSYPAWGRLAHRFGNKPVIFFAMVTWQMMNFVWCFLTPDNAWLLYLVWTFQGIMSAAVLLGMFNILLRLIPAEAKTAAISLNVAISSLVTAIAPIIGGRVLGNFLEGTADPLAIYHRLFLVQPVLALSACLLLLTRVHEPKAGGLTTVFGAMRNARTLGSIFGVTYLVNFVFVKNQKR